MSNVLKRIGSVSLAVAVLALASPALAGPPHRFVVSATASPIPATRSYC